MINLKEYIEKLLKRCARDEEKFKYFHKTGEGDYAQFDLFLGIKVPDIREIVKEVYFKIDNNTILELLHSPYHEERLCALLIMEKRYEKNIDRELIVDMYLNNTKYINGWDLVDLSAPKILGKYVYDNNKQDLLVKLGQSNDMWEQRIAVVSNWYLIKNRSFNTMLSLADIHINTKYDLIEKAVGWMLREIGKRDYDVEYNFLKSRYRQMPRTMLRYSIEKFPEPVRKSFLRGEI